MSGALLLLGGVLLWALSLLYLDVRRKEIPSVYSWIVGLLGSVLVAWGVVLFRR